MRATDFPIGSLIRYYGEVGTRPFYVASHQPPMGANVPTLGFTLGQDAFLVTDQWHLYDWPELDDVIHALKIDRETLTVVHERR